MEPSRLTCIDLDLAAQRGFRRFMSAWLYRDTDHTFVVDPGPLNTIQHLLDSLRRAGVERLDHILLTHIHIDHAGGTAALLEEFPGARVICHPEGVRHMVAPAKLWEGTRQVLGQLAEAYGEILPVPTDRIGFAEKIGPLGLRAFLTPGHASHHCCYLLDDLLFGGEVAGVRCEVPDGIYMRPATPPRFILEVARDSIERMIALAPKYLVFAHYGLVDTAVEHLQIGRDQLELWVKGVAETLALPDVERTAELFAWLSEHDPCFRLIDQLEEDIYHRERIFIANTVRGMTDYVMRLQTHDPVLSDVR
jgi:glyoxylase-like metal-dependent hydrolase (beta-lactamase superfamily II)